MGRIASVESEILYTLQENAEKLLNAEGKSYRIIRVDNIEQQSSVEPFPGTILIEIENGKVVKATTV